ncbi:hypothetical protein ACK8HX_13950 [Oryzobacter sp. R7]|uniref:hypothetical protein n=1 Tax=Oryzobacter faecalis TaxID=3388656 RepID=UPI00398CFD35
MNLNTVTRDGVTWELRSPGAEHYSTERRGGHLFLHSRRDCCAVEDPVVVSPRIVQTLWEKDAAGSAEDGGNDVEWCETCAVRKVDAAP